jgi:hypothetical protein
MCYVREQSAQSVTTCKRSLQLEASQYSAQLQQHTHHAVRLHTQHQCNVFAAHAHIVSTYTACMCVVDCMCRTVPYTISVYRVFSTCI